VYYVDDGVVCNYCLFQHKMSTDLTKIKESVGTIRFRCSRVMPHFSNVNWSLNKWFYSETEHVLLLCDSVDDVVTRLDLKEKVSV